MYKQKHKLIKRIWPLVALAAAVVLLLAAPADAAGVNSAEVISLTNSQRAANGLPALASSSRLNQAAVDKASDMFAKGYFDHYAPDGTSPFTFITAAGYKYTIAAENLAKGCSTSTCVVNGWMGSAGHRSNILNSSITETGVGVVSGVFNSVNTTIVVAFYTKPAGVATPAPKPTAPATTVKQSTPAPAPQEALVEVKAAASALEVKKSADAESTVIIKPASSGKSVLLILPLVFGFLLISYTWMNDKLRAGGFRV